MGSYIDVRARYYDSTKLCNYQVLSIPIYRSHLGEAMFNLTSTLMDSLLGESCKMELIGTATDGAAKTAGRIPGAITWQLISVSVVCTEFRMMRTNWASPNSPFFCMLKRIFRLPRCSHIFSSSTNKSYRTNRISMSDGLHYNVAVHGYSTQMDCTSLNRDTRVPR